MAKAEPFKTLQAIESSARDCLELVIALKTQDIYEADVEQLLDYGTEIMNWADELEKHALKEPD